MSPKEVEARSFKDRKLLRKLYESMVDIRCPCCGEKTGTGSAINDPDEDYRDIVTCGVNGCVFYVIEYTDESIVVSNDAAYEYQPDGEMEARLRRIFETVKQNRN